MKILRKILDTTLVVLALSSIALAISAIYLQISFATTDTKSMVPAIKAGDTLVTRTINSQSIAVGDILVFPHPDNKLTKVAHRVINRNNLNENIIIETKGDANPVKDGWQIEIISKKVAKVIGIIPTAHIFNGSIPRTVILKSLMVSSAFLLLIGIWRLIRQRAGL